MRKIFMAFLGIVLLLSIVNPAYTNHIGEAATNDGETKNTAIPITAPAALKGELKDYSPRYYKVTMPDNGEFTISAANTGDSINVYVMESISQWDEPLAILDSENEIGPLKTSIGFAKGQVIYIMIDGYGETSKYDIQLDFKAKGNFEKEPNNHIAKSQLLSLNTKTSGYVDDNMDFRDYYKFTLTKPGKVTVKLSNSKQGELYFGLMNEDEKDYDYLITNPLKSGSTSMEIGLPAGTYYMSVSGDPLSNEQIPYQLELKFTAGTNYETESNDKKADADPIKLNSSYQGFHNDGYDNDVYSFTLTKKEKLKFTVSNSIDYMTVGNGERDLEWVFPEDTTAGVATKTIELAPDTYYVRINGSARTPYNLKVENVTSTLSASKIAVKNNYGKNDTVTVSGIQKGNLIKVYDKSSGGKLLASQESTGTSITLSIKQLSQKAGKVYVTNTKTGSLESSKTAVSYKAEPSAPLKSSQVNITNNRAKNDVLIVSSIKKGDTIKIYNKASGGKLLVSKKATGTSVDLSVKQLSQKAGKVYVSVTKSGLLESSKTAISYKAEPSAPLKASQITVKNNKGKSDSVTVKSIKKGDIIKVYSKASGGKPLVSKKAAGTSATLSVKQLGKSAGSVYVSVTKSGLLESSKVKASYKKE